MMARESTLVGSYHEATRILVTKKLNPAWDDLGAGITTDPWTEYMKTNLHVFSGRTSQPLPFSLSPDDESKHGMRVALGFQKIRRHSLFQVEVDVLQKDDYEVQLSMLPETEDIHLVVENTELSDLRGYAVAVTDIAISLARTSSAHLGAVKRLNDCFVTLEGISELGDDLEDIESGRYRLPKVLPAGRSMALSEEVVHDDIPALNDENEFRRLKEEWASGRLRGSDVAEMVMHPAYQRIIGMGPNAIPLILRELERKPDHWFWALHAITGANPVPKDSEGNIQKMAVAWLDWGRQHGYDQ